MTKSSIVIWGSGAIGRGFVADLFTAAGYEVVLVDQDQGLVEQLRKAGQYAVVRAKTELEQEVVIIKNFRVHHTSEIDALQAELNRCQLMAVAVYPQVFDAVAKQLVPLLLRRLEMYPRSPLDILLCVNLTQAAEKFRQSLSRACPTGKVDELLAYTGLVETLVIRICPQLGAEIRQREPLKVLTNGYPTLHVDRKAFIGELPRLSSIRFVDDMRAEERRKIYTYNMAQAALAYHGALRGYGKIVECIADEKVRAEAEGALKEVGAALSAEFGFGEQEMKEWNSNVMEQTANPALGDTVQRMGADPLRKLNRNDRLVGAALLCFQHGIHPHYLMRAIAAGLLYQPAEDATAQQIQGKLQKLELREAVKEICGLNDNEKELIDGIIVAYYRLPLEVEWQRRAKQAFELGFEYEKKYHGCGQCVLAALEDVLGIQEPAVFNAATTLSGGLGLYGNATCSALSGSALMIGLLYPRMRENFSGARENKYTSFCLTQGLVDRFIEYYGSCICHDIHTKRMGRPFDLRQKAEREAFEEAGAHDDQCTSTVGLAAQWVVEIIGEHKIEEALKEKGMV